MKKNILITIMTIVWLALMANIIWQGTNGKWYVKDAEKISQLEVAKYTDQLIVVAVSDEEASLCFYEKEDNENWELVLETEALIGKNGLGKTKEGDGKTPVGAFRFINAFGIMEDPGAKIRYTQVNGKYYWVDDADSKYYNQFISTDDVKKDWKSAEHICDYGESYHYVLAISYNLDCIPGVGSAVFLHCSSDGAESTAGCIAIPESYMKKIMEVVEPECVLIIDRVDNILNY